MDEDYDELKARILEKMNEWKALLALDLPDITVRWSEAYHEEDAHCQATTLTTWQYRESYITFYLPTLTNDSESQIERLIAHELVHCIMAPMETHVKAKHAEQCEFAVENMCRTLCHLRSFIPVTAKKSIVNKKA
jgi:hypothetical protein